MGKAVKALDNLQKLLKKNLDVAFNKDSMEDISDIMIKNITTRALVGKGVSNGKQNNFDALEESTIKQRKRYAKNLSGKTSPNQKRSNATATGQMLESISRKVSPGSIFLYFKGKRRKELSGKSSGKSNEEVAEKFQKKRPFFELTLADINEIKRYVRSIILNK